MSWEFIRDDRPKARQLYRCELCDRFIGVKEVHVARTGNSDGDLRTFRMHEKCESMTRDWDDEDWFYNDPGEFRSTYLTTEAQEDAS